MAGNPVTAATMRGQRRAAVIERYLHGQSMRKIALDLALNLGTVHGDIEACRKEWREQRLQNTGDLTENELAKINELERTYWEAWEKSCQPRQTTSQRQTNTQPASAPAPAQPAGTNAGAPVAQALGISWAASTQTVERDGNPSFLAGVERCIERRCKILGLDAPEKKELTGKDGGPVRVHTSDRLDLSKLTDEQLAVLDAILPDDED